MNQSSQIPNQELYLVQTKRKPQQQSETYAYKVHKTEQAVPLTTLVPTDGNWGRDGFAAMASYPIANGFNDYAAPAAVQMPSNYRPLRGMPQIPIAHQPPVSSHNAFSPYL